MTSFQAHRPHGSRRAQGLADAGLNAPIQPIRRQEWAGLGPREVLARYRIGHTPPTQVLEVLLELFNTLHTSLDKTVSHKTRKERAQFLRRFFRDLKAKAGFKTLPDPRNLGQKHVRAMVAVWRSEQLAPGTIQTYLSFLRGLSLWLGKHGFVRQAEHYGLEPHECQRSGLAERDKSWAAQGIDAAALIEKICAYDCHVGASLRLCLALGLRRKESVMFRPHRNLVSFEETGLPPEERQADRYARIKEGSKGGRLRFVPLDSPACLAAAEFAKTVAIGLDAHMGDPARDLKRNLRRFDYVLERFGLTRHQLGATAHGLRHEALNNLYEDVSRQPSPVRGGPPVSPEIDKAARFAVAKQAGHTRIRAAGAYVGRSTSGRVTLPDPSGDVAGSSRFGLVQDSSELPGVSCRPQAGSRSTSGTLRLDDRTGFSQEACVPANQQPRS